MSSFSYCFFRDLNGRTERKRERRGRWACEAKSDLAKREPVTQVP
jgi:hypothetical protein